ncbi:MAG: hypothetical protein NTW14_02980 [bacterium]|nr:hypothetical protein [bacterium]
MNFTLKTLSLICLILVAANGCAQQLSRANTSPASSTTVPVMASNRSNAGNPIMISGSQTLESPRFSISLPKDISVWTGYRASIPITIANKTTENQTSDLLVKTAVNIFVADVTSAIGKESALLEAGRVTVPPNGKVIKNLEVQSLRIGRYEITIAIDGKEIKLPINSQVAENGPAFLYRCWFEGAQFFKTMFSDGSMELTQDAKRVKAKEILKEEIQAGKSEQEAKRDALEQFRQDYSIITYQKKSNWEQVYQQKIDQHTEQYGFGFVDIDGLSWSTVGGQKDSYNWSVGDFMLELSNKYFMAEPFVRVEGAPDWATDLQGPSGRFGFFDANNKVLMDKYENYCTALADRYNGDGINDAPGSPVINHFILANEPTLMWFSVDFDRSGHPVQSGGEGMAPTQWFKDAVQQGGLERAGAKYIDMFGDITFASIKRAAEAIHKVNPKARVATHQFIPGKFGSMDMAMFKYLLDKGIGKYIDAWGLHPANAFDLLSLWKKNPDVPYTLEDAANQSPPFQADGLSSAYGCLDRKGQRLQTVKPVDEIIKANPYMGKLWRNLVDIPYSQPLEDLAELLDRYNLDLPVWVTEAIMIGPLATNRRENLIAALHEYTILFHEKVEITTLASVIEAGDKSGTTPIGYLPDPTAKELLLDINRAIGGAHPIEKLGCTWFAPGEKNYLDYTRTVYKLFNRGDEDIIAIWSNSGKDEILNFTLAPNADISDVRMMKFDADSDSFKVEKTLSAFPSQLTIKPLKEFYYISVRSNQPNLGWLTDIQRQVSAEEADVAAQYQKTVDYLRNARGSLRGSDRGIRSLIVRGLEEAQDAIIMGQYNDARATLEQIQRRAQ